jgi:hypothetical protein
VTKLSVIFCGFRAPLRERQWQGVNTLPGMFLILDLRLEILMFGHKNAAKESF